MCRPRSVTAFSALPAMMLLASCQTPPAPSTITVHVGGGAAPVLQAVTMRTDVRLSNGAVLDFVPDYHFIDADGDVVSLRRELIETNGSIPPGRYPPSLPIYTPPDVQKKGAIFNAGGWVCGPAQYHARFRVWLVDAADHESNRLEYTFTCNGG